MLSTFRSVPTLALCFVLTLALLGANDARADVVVAEQSLGCGFSNSCSQTWAIPTAPQRRVMIAIGDSGTGSNAMIVVRRVSDGALIASTPTFAPPNRGMSPAFVAEANTAYTFTLSKNGFLSIPTTARIWTATTSPASPAPAPNTTDCRDLFFRRWVPIYQTGAVSVYASNTLNNGLRTTLWQYNATTGSLVSMGTNTGNTPVVGVFNFGSEYYISATRDLFGINQCLQFAPNLLAVTLVSSGATREATGTRIEWTTSSEAGTLGYLVERELDGVFVAAHDGVLPSVAGAVQGAQYAFLDHSENGADGATRYRIQEVDSQGVNEVALVEVQVGSRGRAPMAGRFTSVANELQPVFLRRPGVLLETPKDLTTPDALALEVREMGVHRIALSEVAQRLEVPLADVTAALDAGAFTVSHLGQPVASWRDGDDLMFFADAPRPLFAPGAIFRLSLTPDEGVPALDAASGLPSTPLDAYRRTSRFEEDVFAGTVISPDPRSDFWFWRALSNTPTTVEAALPTLSSASSSAELVVRVHPATLGEDGTAQVAVELNGTPLGTLSFSAMAHQEFTLAIPPNTLSTTNTLSFTVNGSNVFVYLNSFDIRHESRFDLGAGAVNFVAEVSGTATLTGAADGYVEVVEQEGGALRRWTLVLDGNGEAALPTLSGRRYFVAPARDVSSVRAIRPSSLLDADQAVDFVLIADPALVAAADGLRSRREREGLASRVVSAEDVYDVFSHSQPSPDALHAFLAYAQQTWRVAPRYVALVGTATFDYRDVQGRGENRVPTQLIQTPSGLYSSDAAFGDLDGDGLVDVAVGRLPARDAVELEAMTARIAAWEEQPPHSPRAVLLADDPQPYTDYVGEVNRVGERMSAAFEQTLLSPSGGGLAARRADVLDALQSAPQFFYYAGHGGLDRFGRLGLLTTGDLPLTPTTLPTGPVIAPTCVAARHEASGFESIGEELVRDPSGPVAVWAASGVTIGQQSHLLGMELTSAFTHASAPRMGDAIRMSEASLHDSLGESLAPWTLQIQALLGDPTMRCTMCMADDLPPGDDAGVPNGDAGVDADSVPADSGIVSPQPMDQVGGGACSVRGAGERTWLSGVVLLLGLMTLVFRRTREQ